MKHSISTLLIGVFAGAALTYAISHQAPSQTELQAQYYAASVATLVSPHSIRERMTHGDDSFILVDTRAQVDYEREHIIGAINIDSAQTPEKVIADFAALNQDQQIIIYCYSASCMNGRKVGNLLAEHDIFVQEMTIGWNEWRYNWEGWNYDTEWDTHQVTDYVIAGSEPGVLDPSLEQIAPCGIAGELGC